MMRLFDKFNGNQAMRKFIQKSRAGFLAAGTVVLMSSLVAQAANWETLTTVGGHTREIDKSSISGQAPEFTYATRHVFGDLDEYRIGKRGIKYLVISGKANCQLRTTSRLAVDAYDENMALISRQVIQNPEESVVSADSIEELTLDYLCKSH